MKQFEAALSAAEKDLAKKTRLRDKARTDLTSLDYEIPRLVQTINVLRQQLGREPIPVTANAVGLGNKMEASLEGFTAHEVDPASMGSIPSTAPLSPEGGFDIMQEMGDEKEWL